LNKKEVESKKWKVKRILDFRIAIYDWSRMEIFNILSEVSISLKLKVGISEGGHHGYRAIRNY
jgi:hypothetical protein